MRPRLAYRDVASSTNRLSLIAAILPAGVVTTHSLFCLKTRLSGDNQAFLCGMLNSFVANYLVRQVMTTHLGSTTVEAFVCRDLGTIPPLSRRSWSCPVALRREDRRRRVRAPAGAGRAMLSASASASSNTC